MAFSMFNNNPHGLNVGDCTVRAASKALNQSWETTYLDLVTIAYDMADLPSSNAVFNAYLRSKGFRRYIIPNTCPDCYRFSDFAGEYFKGIYILGTGTHVACVIDGVIYDSWDSSDEIPIYYYAYEREDWT